MFAEESLFYPYADCEDRSILLATLLTFFTNLPAVVLNYPTHVSLAVAIPFNLKGDFLFMNGQKYYICDATLTGGKVGNGMLGLRGIKPEVIEFDSNDKSNANK